MARLYGDDPPVEHFAEFYRRVWEQMENIWLRCLELGLNVVLDFGFSTRQERDAVRAKVAAIGGQARLYRLTCPEDEAWRRVEKRNSDLRGSLYISDRERHSDRRPDRGSCTRRVGMSTFRRSPSSDRGAPYSLTSIAALSPSLTRLKQIDVRKIITPGSVALIGLV
jgi:hypothetical protein